MESDLKDVVSFFLYDEQYYCEETATVMALEYGEAFQNLTDKEKMYTYYLFKAIAAGWRVFLVISLFIQQITAIQTSKESPYIISLLLRVFKHESADGLKERLMKEGFVLFILSFYVQKDEKCIDSFILYCYNVFGNMGNYRYCHKNDYDSRGFGDTKILPRCSKSDFEDIIRHSLAYQNESKEIEELWENCGDKVFSHESSELRLGLGDSGVSSYYSDNITVDDIKLVQRFV